MADTLGTLTSQILFEIERDSTTYTLPVQRAILSALNYIEEEAYWLLEKMDTITVLNSQNFTALPADFNQLMDVTYLFGERFYGMAQGFKVVNWPDYLTFRDIIYDSQPKKASIWGDNFYIYPYADGNIPFQMYYYYTDATRPDIDSATGLFPPSYVSVWFDRKTVDIVRYKALEIIYRDVLITPELALPYKQAYDEFLDNLIIKNNQRQNINILSV